MGRGLIVASSCSFLRCPALPCLLSSAALSPKNSLSRFSCKTFLLKLAAAEAAGRGTARSSNKATALGHATVDTLCQSSLLQQSLLVTVNVTFRASAPNISIHFCSRVSFSFYSCSGYWLPSPLWLRFLFLLLLSLLLLLPPASPAPAFPSAAGTIVPTPALLLPCSPCPFACLQRIYFARLFLDFWLS